MIYTLLANGFEEIEALAVVDILRRAQIDVKLISITGSHEIEGAHGIVVKADDTIKNIGDDFEFIFLPGGYPGYVNLGDSKDVCALLEKAYNEDKKIIAICAAPSVLGELGILKGKKACCFTGFEDTLTGATVSFDDVCVSDNIITSRGAGTAHKLAFKIVELLKGKDIAQELSDAMLYNS